MFKAALQNIQIVTDNLKQDLNSEQFWESETRFSCVCVYGLAFSFVLNNRHTHHLIYLQ